MDVCNCDITNRIKADALWMRKRILELSLRAGKNGSHVGGSLSMVETLAVLFAIMNRDKEDLDKRDRFILSKGHGALALYCALERTGLLTKEETDTFESNGTQYYAHAKRNIAKGIEFSGGSLSLCISFAVCVALSCKEKGLDNHIYVLVGDGECNEGHLWEAAMAAASFKLTNLTVLVDCNGLQSDGFTKDIMDSSSLSRKFSAFGFDAKEVDGHSVDSLREALSVKTSFAPQAIIANTIKGKGVSFMESEKNWHHGVLTEKLYEQAIQEIIGME